MSSNSNDDRQPPVLVQNDVVKGDDAEIPVALAANVASTSAPKRQRPDGLCMLVEPSETVPPEVKWEPESRKFHDKPWGFLYALAFLAFIGTGSFLVANANPRYEWVTLENTTALENSDTIRVVSSHFRDDGKFNERQDEIKLSKQSLITTFRFLPKT